MSIKKIMLSTILLAGISTPLMSFAGLTIINKTTKDSTSKINQNINRGAKCSNELLGPRDGVTRAGETKEIGDLKIKIACAAAPKKCIADVYMDDHCGSDIITTVTFNTQQGIQNVTPPKGNFLITYTNWSIKIEEPVKH